MTHTGWVADIGATNCRFAWVDADGRLGRHVTLATSASTGLVSACRAFFHLEGGGTPGNLDAPRAVVAVAGPVSGDLVRLTNLAWGFSIEAARRELGLRDLVVWNDFAALAVALPCLVADDLETLRAGEVRTGAPRALIGPGSGLGVAGLFSLAEQLTVLAGEGGHRDLAPTTEREWQVVRRLASRFGHVSAERVLSGPGLAEIYRALGEIEGGDAETLAPEEVTRRARAGGDPVAAESARLFSGWLGAVAGDLVLTFGALGGLYVGGGVVGALGEVFDREAFGERFLAKGRMREYLEPVPISRIVRPDAALLGCASLLERGYER